MELYIDDPEVEQLAEELAALMNTTVEVAVRTAIVEEIKRLRAELAEEAGDSDQRG